MRKSPVEIFLLNDHKSGGFEHRPGKQPKFNSILVRALWYFDGQYLFKTFRNTKYTHIAINKDHLDSEYISIRVDYNNKTPSLVIVHEEFNAGTLLAETNVGIHIEFNWDYIDYFRDKYIIGVRNFLKSINRDLEDYDKLYSIFTEKLTDVEKLEVILW